MSRHYDRQGKPITMMQWATSFEDRDMKQVALDNPSEGVAVSTVWLGLDHQHGDGPPLIFETMVFGGPLDQEMDRYSTEEEALLGHQKMLERVKEAK